MSSTTVDDSVLLPHNNSLVFDFDKHPPFANDIMDLPTTSASTDPRKEKGRSKSPKPIKKDKDGVVIGRRDKNHVSEIITDSTVKSVGMYFSNSCEEFFAKINS